jgi:hypothetical protein
MRKNIGRGDCKEQQLCVEFIGSKESSASRDIRKKPKEHTRGEAPHTPSIRAHMPPALHA